MKCFFLFFILFLVSCGNKTDKYAKYIVDATDKDTVTSEMMKSNDFSNSIFINEIASKDGQKNKAGLGFIMDIDESRFFVTAKHLLGPDGGFKDSIRSDEIPQKISEWTAKTLSGKIISPNFKNIVRANGDVLIFDEIKNQQNSGIKLFKLSKIMIPLNTREPIINGKVIPNRFYLVAYSESGKEELFPLTYLHEFYNHLVFAMEKKFDYHGFSGGPILDSKGNVFAILSGAFYNSGDEQIAGTKIRPIDLK